MPCMFYLFTGYSPKLHGSRPQEQLDTTFLSNKAAEFLHNGLAVNTRTTYIAGQHRYRNFCQAINVTPIPTSEQTLLLFATHLATCNITYSTIKVYMSAIRHMHVTERHHEEFYSQLTPRVQLALKGIQKSQATSHTQRTRLPITLEILQSINGLLSAEPHSYDNILIWAACCLAFFGFLRVSEFTIPNDTNYDSECHLSPSDISVDNRDYPQLLKVTIKQSKTDPFRKGVDLYLGATNGELCPVKALLPYLAIRPERANSPLFIFKDGRPLTRQRFSNILNTSLSRLGYDSTLYNTHSFRIGAATTARQANIPDPSIQMLGRWKSNAYLAYIRTPPQELARFSSYLITGYQKTTEESS